MRIKTVMDQMNAEKPDDMLSDLESKYERRVGRHRKFWMETPAGNDAHIFGDPRMPAATKRALGEMIDAAVAAANNGLLPKPPK